MEITRFISESAPWNDLLKEYYRNSSPNDVVPIGGNYGHCQLFKDICLALEMRCVTAPADKPKLAALCQKTFSGPVRKLNKILINADPLDVYTHCTRLLAFLVEHCAPLIHHRDANESLLREIIALTVCNVGADNTPAVVKRRRMDMATECLLHILRGLMKCDWNQNEVLKKQIFECYRVELVRLAHDRKNVIMEASPLVGALKVRMLKRFFHNHKLTGFFLGNVYAGCGYRRDAYADRSIAPTSVDRGSNFYSDPLFQRQANRQGVVDVCSIIGGKDTVGLTDRTRIQRNRVVLHVHLDTA